MSAETDRSSGQPTPVHIEMGASAPAAPEIEREYIEIYPVKWESLRPTDLRSMLSTRSHEGINDITLYLHLPFCPEMCAFCGFNKTWYRESVYRDYVKALAQEIQYYRDHPDLQGRRVTAVYFGGGTGSMLAPDDLEFILRRLSDVFPLAADCEFTVESHPNTLDRQKLEAYAGLGVNRLSIGIQSFVDRKLQALGRANTSAVNQQVLTDAKAVGIDKVSIDLMYRVPSETIDELTADLRQILRYEPTNVSCYSLIVEGTKFERALPLLPDARSEASMSDLIRSTFDAAGYQQWSLADFCQPGGTTRYNINYWGAPQTLLLGLGAGAHTHYFGGHTWTNVYSVTGYLQAIAAQTFAGVVGQRTDVSELMRRYMVLGVHCLTVPASPFSELFGIELREYFARELDSMTSRGWLEVSQRQIMVTEQGQAYLNNIALEFFSETCRGEVQPWSKHLPRQKSAEPLRIEV